MDEEQLSNKDKIIRDLELQIKKAEYEKMEAEAQLAQYRSTPQKIKRSEWLESLSAFSSLFSGIAIAIVGGTFTYLYSTYQADQDLNIRSHDLKLRQLEIVNTFSSKLSSRVPQERELAYKLIATLEPDLLKEYSYYDEAAKKTYERAETIQKAKELTDRVGFENDTAAADNSYYDIDNNKILWVDNRPENIMAFIEVLKGKGFHVDTVTSTEQALTRVRQSEYKVIISDMSRGSEGKTAGITLAKLLKSNKFKIPVLILAGRDTIDQYKDEAIAAGAKALYYDPVALINNVDAISKNTSEE